MILSERRRKLEKKLVSFYFMTVGERKVGFRFINKGENILTRVRKGREVWAGVLHLHGFLAYLKGREVDGSNDLNRAKPIAKSSKVCKGCF